MRFEPRRPRTVPMTSVVVKHVVVSRDRKNEVLKIIDHHEEVDKLIEDNMKLSTEIVELKKKLEEATKPRPTSPPPLPIKKRNILAKH